METSEVLIRRFKTLSSLVWVFLLLSVSVTSRAADNSENYLRCAAISYIGFRVYHDPADKERYKTAFDLHSKWAAWFYPDDHAKYKAAINNTLASLQNDLSSKKMSEQQLSAEAASCMRLQTRTAMAFMECLKSSSPSKEEKESCAKLSVGL